MEINVERLKAIMKQRGMTQAQLSRKTNIPKSAISQYLTKRFGPKDGRLATIANALDTSAAWLMGYTDNPDKNAQLTLSQREECIILQYRSNPQFRASVDTIIDKPKLDVFRAAKSQGGTVAPAYEEISEEYINRLNTAPETDEDL